MVMLTYSPGLSASSNRIGMSPLYTALTMDLSAIAIGIGMQRRTSTRGFLLPVMLTVAPESTALAVVRSATSNGVRDKAARRLDSFALVIVRPPNVTFFLS